MESNISAELREGHFSCKGVNMSSIYIKVPSFQKKKRNSCNRAQLLTIRITRGWGITCWRPVPQQCIKTSTNGVLHGSNPKMTELSTLEANSRETAWPLFCPGYGYGLFDLLARLSDVSLCTIIEAPDMATSFTQLQVQR